MRSFIFLDIDGVLNDHTRHANGYCGMTDRCVTAFNRVLADVPEAKIVLTSAWRYACLSLEMSSKGFEIMMLTHGVAAKDRVRGCTASDEAVCGEGQSREWLKAHGVEIRCTQIDWYLKADINHCAACVVIDDLDLSLPNFVRTDGDTGLTEADADKVIGILQAQLSEFRAE